MSGKDRAHYLICYDVSDDRNRTRICNMLLDYGERLQFSVFEADLSPEDLADILERSRSYIANGDSLRIYPLCRSCAAGVHRLGRDTYHDPTSARIV
jgi:CRISPR-associated protein Cas2